MAADSIRLARRIAASPALSRYRPEEWLPGPAYRSEDELRQAAGKIGTTIFHPVGTCAMGRRPDQGAVVDAPRACTGWKDCASPTPRSCP